MPRAIVIRAAGTNCDAEMCRAFEMAGASADLVHLDRLIDRPATLDHYDLVAFPGGFSYGDDVASGRIFAMRLRERLWPSLHAAAARGVPMIGACNGFQVMVQVGLLGLSSVEGCDGPPAQSCALTHNAGGRFIDRWVRVVPNADSPCIWTRHLAEEFSGGPAGEGEVGGGGGGRASDALRLPIAHGEGRFVTDTPGTLAALEANQQVALRYAADDNPNGSSNDIAGICDPTGRILGLMPHPERYLDWTRHPFWTRLDPSTRHGDTPGLSMFRAAVVAAVEARV